MPSPFFGTTSRWGLRWLQGNSNVDDIDTGFQALATDIDNLPLSLLPTASSGGTVTAVDGQMVNCTGAAQTVTLPTSAKGLLGARAGGTQTGANPVTLQVTPASGQLIKGKGLGAGVTRIALGAVGAAVVLLFDGANWLIVAGEQDTGWVNLILPSGMVAGSGAVARQIGNRVQLAGRINATTTFSLGSTLFTLPLASMYPTATSPAVGLTLFSSSASRPYGMTIGDGGSGVTYAYESPDGALTNGMELALDSLTFLVD